MGRGVNCWGVGRGEVKCGERCGGGFGGSVEKCGGSGRKVRWGMRGMWEEVWGVEEVWGEMWELCWGVGEVRTEMERGGGVRRGVSRGVCWGVGEVWGEYGGVQKCREKCRVVRGGRGRSVGEWGDVAVWGSFGEAWRSVLGCGER